MSSAIAVFVKTPSLSPIKTRLAAGIGQVRAEAFYRLSLKAVQRSVGSVDATSYWAVGERDGLEDPLWSGLAALYTGDGCLGARQHHIYKSLLAKHNKVILIGADAPQLSPEILNEALAVLDAKAFVVGPARDGGYYLFGGCESVDEGTWLNVEYSRETTRKTLVGALPFIPVELPLLTDVDTEGDLIYLVKEMPKNIAIEQQNIVDWIDSNR